MSDELKFIKPRISLRDVFRTTPKARKDYVQGVARHNIELRRQAEQRRMDVIAQQKLMDKYDESIRAYNRAASRPIEYTYAPQIYVESTPAPTPTPTTSTSRSSSSGRTVSSMIGIPISNLPKTTSRPTPVVVPSSNVLVSRLGISTPAQRKKAARSSIFFK
jgi:hypothetical protein